MPPPQALGGPDPLRNVVDALIIGAGPAGLSAALALGRVMRSAAVFDSHQYRNEASEHVHTVPLHDHENPATIRASMKQEIANKYKTIIFTDTTAVTAKEEAGVFEVMDESGKEWKGRKIILAIGCRDILPDIPGFNEGWGKSIIHCLFCRGFEESQGTALRTALLVPNELSTQDKEDFLVYSQLLFQFSSRPTVLLNGNATNPSHAAISAIAVTRGLGIQAKAIRKLDAGDPASQAKVEYSDGTVESFDLIFHHPRTQLRGDMADRLGLELTESGNIMVSGCLQSTSRHGVFAAGDCATDVKQVAVAIGQGVSAGIGANFQIVEEDVARS
ncbi:hypothetical protein Neosp_009581 [[Neocosmospora] mangrovei]